ncbi:hypothetical protein DEA98_13560 [Brucella pseudogrignonensis]|uniref:Uncharacterized protein n=1 Tax=Brucella pseudogrignonensis TaxID=419475 RepID=A0A7Y3T428_9HYPH|nr:hypothetical protein [Brucella pseudogrignonensis]MCM0751930.1 hypothetical protein [Brucella pseudogrignonensis]NNV20674.1 hypothetical protein [Brucella pseudogrignonensis]
MKLVLAGLSFFALSVPNASIATTLQQHAEDQAALIIAKDLCPLTYNQDAWGNYIVATVPKVQMQAFLQEVTELVLKTGFDVERSPANVRESYCNKAASYIQTHQLAN